MEATQLVKEMHALVGADALHHSVPGLSRREAARIKSDACRDMERERRASAEHVIVSAPGVLRGFDAMELRGDLRRTHALIAADGCVPYRTSWALSDRYNGAAVEALLRRDFETHGPPVVLRMDRATQHGVETVHQLLAAHKVLVLHGPPRYPAYYGQLERQNREHRAWLAGSSQADLDTMMAALNAMWRRRTLGWRTAAEAWAARTRLDVDRDALADEVYARAKRLRARLDHVAGPRGLAWRLAVKQALTNRGLLRVVPGGWC